MAIAEQEARRLGHEEVGTAHLLLGLAAAAPDLLEVPLETLRATVVALQGSGPAPVAGPLPFSTEATAALTGANTQALALGHTTIDPAHLLLALLDAGGGGARAVREAGAIPSELREWARGAAGRPEADRTAYAPAYPQAAPPGATRPGARPPATPVDHSAALRAGDPVSVALGGDPTPIGDLGHPAVDRRLLELMLVNDTPAAQLLRAHGVDEARLRLALPAQDRDPPA